MAIVRVSAGYIGEKIVSQHGAKSGNPQVTHSKPTIYGFWRWRNLPEKL